MANFIVDDDDDEEEEEEEEMNSESERERDRYDPDSEEELVFDGAQDTMGSTRKRADSRRERKGSRAGGDEEDDENDDVLVRVTPSMKRSKVVVVEESEVESQEEKEDEEEEEESSESELEGPALYAQVDMLRREREEQMARYTHTHFSRSEAVQLYIELLARVHTEPQYLARNEDMCDPKYLRFLAAQKNIEDLICTTREVR